MSEQEKLRLPQKQITFKTIRTHGHGHKEYNKNKMNKTTKIDRERESDISKKQEDEGQQKLSEQDVVEVLKMRKLQYGACR